ncbi:CHAT domain-containing protein [Streptomyces sp. NPDC006270]|uniref:CHAT domain-containing protein n=1 Tax=Streptomyces sp. NPDC006270 TaxID=3364741 RepID=UPI00369E9E62
MRQAMAAPDDAVPFLSDAADTVLARGTQYSMAHLVHNIRDRLTPDQAGGPDGVDIEVVFLAACYHLARCGHLPEDEKKWDGHAATFLFAVVHAVRPDAVPQPLRDAFAETPPQVVPPYEIVHTVGIALFLPSAVARDPRRVALATVLMAWAQKEARGDPSEHNITFNLGTALVTLSEVDKADGESQRTRGAGLHVMREALTGLPSDDPARPEMLNGLMRAQAGAPPGVPAEDSGLAEVARYMRDGDTDRLDKLAERLRASLESSAAGGTERAHRRIELGQVLRMRFEAEGELADLDHSIAELTAVLDCSLADALGNEDRAHAYSFLGLAHLDRYVTLANSEDLDRATKAVRRACAVGAAASASHPQRLTNLAAVLTTRFGVYQDVTELDEVVRHLEYAVAATPATQHDRPVMLIKLAVALRTRGIHTLSDADLAAAEELLRDVAGRPSDAGPNQQLARMELGHLLTARGLEHNARRDQAEVVTLYRTTALAPSHDVRIRLLSASMWGLACAKLGDMGQARTAFAVALGDLLPKLAGPALGRESQEARLREMGSVSTAAAAVEIGAGRPRQALIRLEQGRGVLLSQALRLRRRNDDLAAAAPALADRYERVCGELVAPQRGPQERKASAAEFDRVTREIREIAGFDGFHRPPDWAWLRGAAGHGPVVVINVSTMRCDALILHRRSGRSMVEALHLPGVTMEETDRRAAGFRAAVVALTASGGAGGTERFAHDRSMKRTLRWLGAEIVVPVLHRLGLNRPAERNEPLPRVWWCPTGSLSMLPLHAAVLEEGDRRSGAATVYTHDRVVSSYIPTIGSLLHARATPAPESGRGSLIAVGVDAGDTYPRLTALQEELDAARGLPGPRTELADAEATPDAVLAALRSHTHAHLACHGVRDAADPSRSRLLLHDGVLTLRELAAERLRNAEFAYLSACHSAAPGEELVNEVISVASAFQLCGYRHVIGSLWTIEDDMGPLVAREVYRRLAAPGTAYALHQAVGVLREHPRYREPLFWASLVHSGP